ncbi:SDR family oxidoreductase [Actinopolyspora halophila]|uniref:SDR family oxidoreductase n=1 Tax=Actinopolyspora halophila TaxID=1850 RepID=UPI00037C3EEC|nr:NmrA family NAD(P)-binding protein [Actinopolyspora halophila]
MAEKDEHLVIGSSGFQGAAVARTLVAEGHRVRGFARGTGTPAPRAPELVTVHGDLADPDSLREAFRDVTHAAVQLPLHFDARLIETYAHNVVAAAREANVRRLVYNTNTPVPDTDTSYAAYDTRRIAEAILRDSGLPVVVLRPPVYLDNLFSPWNGPELAGDGVLSYPLPADLRVSWLSHDDLAAATVAALHREGLEDTTLRIGGPEAVTGAELAAEFSRGMGRPIVFRPQEVDEFESRLGRVLGPEAASGVGGIYRWLSGEPDAELFVADHDTVRRELGIITTPIARWVAAQPWHIWLRGTDTT